MNGYKKEAIFHLPGIFTPNNSLLNVLIGLLRNEKELAMDNIKIGSFYGSPNAIWNGGRVLNSPKIPIDDLKKMSIFYYNKDIPIRFTFTNPLIEEKHLDDKYGNIILQIFDNDKNEILCNTECLENYIKSRYNYKLISSTTKCLKDKNAIQKEIDKNQYRLVVLDYNHNNDFDFIEQLNNRNKLEVLCNPVCDPNCSRRTSHYIYLGKTQLNGFDEFPFVCKNSCRLFYEAAKNTAFISKENINKYLDLGINNFKLEGRTAYNYDLLEILIYYLVKPEFSLEVRERVINILNEKRCC